MTHVLILSALVGLMIGVMGVLAVRGLIDFADAAWYLITGR